MKSFNHLILFLLLFSFSNRGALAQESTDTTAQITGEVVAVNSAIMEELSEKASDAYRKQDFKESTKLYEELIAEGIERDRISAEIYYNLGNAYFRDN